MGSSPFFNLSGDMLPEELRLKKAFEDADAQKPGAQEALSGLAASYDNSGEAPDSKLSSGGLSALAGLAEPQEQKADWGKIAEFGIPALVNVIAGATGHKNLQQLAAGFQQPSLQQWTEQKRQDQLQQLQRRQRAWDDAYAMSQQLPAEVLSTPGMEGLAKAAAAFQADMADGKVDNEKTLSNFHTQLAMHKEELQKLTDSAQMRAQAAAKEQETRLAMQTEQKYLDMAREVLADPTGEKSAEYGMSREQAQQIDAKSRAQQYIEVDGTMYDAQTAIQLQNQERQRSAEERQKLEDETRHKEWQQEHQIRVQQLDTQRRQLEATLANNDAHGALRAYADVVGTAKETYLKLNADAIEAAEPEERARLFAKAEDEAFEDQSDSVMQTAERFGLIGKAMDIGDGETDLIRVGNKPMEYPSDDRVRAIRAEIQSLKEQQARAPEGPAGPSWGEASYGPLDQHMAPGTGASQGESPGLIDSKSISQRVRAAQDKSFGESRQAYGQRLSELEAKLQTITEMRGAVHREVNRLLMLGSNRY